MNCLLWRKNEDVTWHVFTRHSLLLLLLLWQGNEKYADYLGFGVGLCCSLLSTNSPETMMRRLRKGEKFLRIFQKMNRENTVAGWCLCCCRCHHNTLSYLCDGLIAAGDGTGSLMTIHCHHHFHLKLAKSNERCWSLQRSRNHWTLVFGTALKLDAFPGSAISIESKRLEQGWWWWMLWWELLL